MSLVLIMAFDMFFCRAHRGDAGYRHIGRCSEMESLVLMYCRDATLIPLELSRDIDYALISRLAQLVNSVSHKACAHDREEEWPERAFSDR